jgi:hypothetical protein
MLALRLFVTRHILDKRLPELAVTFHRSEIKKDVSIKRGIFGTYLSLERGPWHDLKCGGASGA